MAGESSDGPALASAATNEWVIADEVLGVQLGHRKGAERIVKSKRKAPNTSYSTVASGSEQSHVAEDQSQLFERVDD